MPPKTKIQTANLQLVVIIWEDTFYRPTEDQEPHLVKPQTILMQTAGWLISQTRKYTNLAVDAAPFDNTVRGIITIPTKLVKEIIRTDVHPKPFDVAARDGVNLS